MLFLHAIFCFKGFDDRNRFFITSLVSLVGFVFLSAIFYQYFFVNIVILLLLNIVLTASTTRRLRDAQLSKNWQLVPGILFLITGLISLNIDSSSSYYLLVLPLVSIALLLTYPSQSKLPQGNYIFGYAGPVDLSIYQQTELAPSHHSERIEPTLLANTATEQITVTETPAPNHVIVDKISNQKGKENHPDIGELIRLNLLNNRKFQVALITTVALILVSVLIHSALSGNPTNDDSEIAHQEETATLTKITNSTVNTQKNHPLTMPDDFTLYLSQYEGVTIHWQADQATNGELWSQRSATGEKSCQKMSFNKGSAIRPLEVVVENGTDYFANFSPLDSTELIKALAFRGNFKLCGYPFSLKGTQALLGKHNAYAQFLETKA